MSATGPRDDAPTWAPALGWGLTTTVAMVAALEVLVVWRWPAAAGSVDVQRLAMWTVAAAAGGVVAWARQTSGTHVVESEPELDDELSDSQQSALRQAVLDQLSEGLLVFDERGRLVSANGTAGRLLGIKALPEGVPMRVLAEVPKLRTTVVEALRSGALVEREVSAPKGPSRALLARAAPVELADGRGGVALVLLDVTRLRQMEGRWKQFAGDAAHELRTPVAAMGSNLEALEMVLGAEGPGASFLRGATRQASRMADLVDKLMQLVRMDGQVSLQQQDVSLETTLDQVLDSWLAVDEATASRVQRRGRLPAVLGDPAAVQQVMRNLVENALRYSAGPVYVRAEAVAGDLELVVEDRGPGIPDAYKESIFERFVRVDVGRSREVGGTGLGLSIVRELTEAMGGAVRVEDAEPHGARVVVSLPASGTALDVLRRSP